MQTRKVKARACILLTSTKALKMYFDPNKIKERGHVREYLYWWWG